MENFYEKVKIIEGKFFLAGFYDYGQKLADLIIEGGTVGEKFTGIAFELHRIKHDNPEVYLLAKSEIDEIIDYAKSINYLD